MMKREIYPIYILVLCYFCVTLNNVIQIYIAQINLFRIRKPNTEACSFYITIHKKGNYIKINY